MRFWLFPVFILLISSCYEPKEGCLDIEATNYDVSADDQCPTCCKYPIISIQMQHHISYPLLPDTSFSMKYATIYQALFDTNQFYFIDRGRFFISDLKLVGVSGEEVGVLDSIWLPTTDGDSIFVENNFSKHDRDLFQAATLGTVKTVGMFTGIRFTLGIPQNLLDVVRFDSVKTTLPLGVKNDTISYDSLLGIIPTRLVFRPDTLVDTQPIDLKFEDSRQISLYFLQPFSVERGFNIKLVIRLNYSILFKDVDFKNDDEVTIRSKIDSQLTNAFSIVSAKLE